MVPPVRPLVPFVTLLLALTVFAGCIADSDDDGESVPDRSLDPAVLAELVVQDHDHSDRAAHAGTAGMDLLGFSPAHAGEVPAGSSVNEVAAWGHYAYVSRGPPLGGFAVIDIEDPTAPEVVGEWSGEAGFDIEVTDDGRYVLFATQRNGQPLGFPGTMTSEPTHHQPRGIYVVDVSDPTNPVYESFLPHPWNGVHTMEYLFDEETEEELVIIQTYDLSSSLVPGVPTPTATMALPPTQRVTTALLDRDAPDGVRIVPQGLYQVQDVPPPDQFTSGTTLIMPHDSHVERHPLTGERLLYVAYWDAGLRIVNIDDLANPSEVAAWTDFAPSSIVSLHDVKTVPVLIDGRHITVAGPEIVVAPETGQFTVLDTTDPRDIKKLGHWVLPGEGLIIPGEEPFLFSPHVFYINETGVIVLAHNHAGVWMVDIGSAEKLMAPETLGYAMPVEGLPEVTARGPSVWTAMWWEGLVLATDGPSGLYVYAPSV